MDSFKGFTKVIESYLKQMAEIDELFAAKFANPEKNIKDCCNYILSVVKKSASKGCLGCADDEIYALAVHYYEEDIKDIKDESSGILIVTNQEIELTEEEKIEARKAAITRYQEEELAKLRNSKPKKSSEKKEVVEPSLFD